MKIARPENGGPLPWDRLPGESTKAFEAFQVYLKLGSGRSLDACFRALKERQRGGNGAAKGGKPSGNLNRWSATHDWVSRAAAWDRHISEAQARAMEEATAKAVAGEAEVWAKRNRQRHEGSWASHAYSLHRLNRLIRREDSPKEKPASASAAAAAIALVNATRPAAVEAIAANLPAVAQPNSGAVAGWTNEEAAAGIRAALQIRRERTSHESK